MHHLAVKVLPKYDPKVSIGLHIVAWLVQFFGHGVFENRKPALLDSLGQSIHAAVFFVWLELLFFLGYKPRLHDDLMKEARRLKAETTGKAE